jgi:exopolyphosphatase/guanosine-5'-triphosphate,3'-diphosphate pyrophosphatase
MDGVKERLGIEPEVISGEEEAALSFAGAIQDLPQEDGPFLVVDIGGGSTEFVYGQSSVEFAKSVNIGCVRMSERHFTQDPAGAQEVEDARKDIQEAIKVAASIVPITKAKTLVAVAGTATTVAAAALELGEYDRHSIHLSRISAEKTHIASHRFLSMTREERLALGYMHPGRVEVIAAGSLVLSEIMKATGAKEFVACESDILDGMAWSI